TSGTLPRGEGALRAAGWRLEVRPARAGMGPPVPSPPAATSGCSAPPAKRRQGGARGRSLPCSPACGSDAPPGYLPRWRSSTRALVGRAHDGGLADAGTQSAGSRAAATPLVHWARTTTERDVREVHASRVVRQELSELRVAPEGVDAGVPGRSQIV